MKITLTRSGDEITVGMRGDVDEGSAEDFSTLLTKLEVPSVVFDAERVELVDSLGARQWINFIQSLTKKNIKLSFKNCSPAFVESCNIYPKFVPHHSIKSLYMPADCACGTQNLYLVTGDKFLADDPLSGMKCEKCGAGVTSVYEIGDYLQCVKGG